MLPLRYDGAANPEEFLRLYTQGILVVGADSKAMVKERQTRKR